MTNCCGGAVHRTPLPRCTQPIVSGQFIRMAASGFSESNDNTQPPLRVRRGVLREGWAMVEDIVGCVIAVAFGVMVAFQVGGEG